MSQLFPGGSAPLRIGEPPPGLGVEAASCAPCHQAIAAEWRTSQHASAWRDPIFGASYVQEPLAFCRNCHAPLNDGATPRGVAAREGINCAVCHVRDGAILGTGRSAAEAPHPVRRVTALATSEFCAPCHEFGFHTGEAETAELQQSTMSEWRARLAADPDLATCQGCHMPRVASTQGDGGHRSHAFLGRGDSDLMARAVDVDVAIERSDDEVWLIAKLTPGEIGHAFPTGDLFRRLELWAWVEGSAPADHRKLVYARSFADRTGPTGPTTERYELADTRVGELAEVERAIAIVGLAPGQTEARIHWRLDYLLMPERVARQNGVSAATNVTTLREGVLSLP